MNEPTLKRAVIFIDGQNLFHAAKEAFGFSYPNYDALKLSKLICQKNRWELAQVRFYTGIPASIDNPFWNQFWSSKLAAMGRQKIHVYSRSLRYRNQTIKLSDGTSHTFLVGQEKGIDIRIALDIVIGATYGSFDVAAVFSQDQDLSEVADEIRKISELNQQWIKIGSCFPQSPTSKNTRGINGTDWIRIDRSDYELCIDPRDYRPKKS